MNLVNALEHDLALARHWLGCGNASAAEMALQRVLSSAPSNTTANELMAYLEEGRGNVDAALLFLERATRSSKASAEAWYYLGILYKRKQQYGKAANAFSKSLSLAGDFFEGLHDLGVVLANSEQYALALKMFDKAIVVRPSSWEAYYNKGKLLLDLKRFGEAVTNYEYALSLNSDIPYVQGDYLYAKMNSCNWKGLQEDFDLITGGIESGRKVSSPFPLLATPSSPALQKKCAEIYVQDKFTSGTSGGGATRLMRHSRIRIGYFSADFHDHATAHLMAHLFELHDRSSFEVFGFSFGPPSEDLMRERLVAAFERFIDVRDKSDAEIADLARHLEIDIAVDLKGFTRDSRTAIFSERAAPIQVSYLGYPGTMGAGYIDYLVADTIVIPKEDAIHYTEKIAYLPNSYQVNDATKEIAATELGREEFGLPRNGFVFCCFNASYKITPDVFDIWMRLLQSVPGSVLWLLEGDQAATENLLVEATKRGVEPSRLIFAGRTGLARHLARHRLADLFLDTFYYNAHTTASDALWAGLPVLTCTGQTFAARVATSLLNAVGLPELVTRTFSEYEALAYELASDPVRLEAVTQRLRKTREQAPLFNTRTFVGNIERAYIQMWNRFQSGLKTDHIHISENS